MHLRFLTIPFAAVTALGVLSLAGTAHAKCTRLAFSVNDYGKDGPTKDAKALLDKYIASWAAQNGVKSYTTGKKDVKCELFLDVGLFDEHTCRAEASVCWGDTAGPKGVRATPAASPAASPEPRAAAVIEPAKKAAKSAAPSSAAPAAAAPNAPAAPKAKVTP